MRLALVAALSGGCFRIEYINTDASSGPTGLPEEVWHHRAVNGMWEIEGPVEVDSLCPAGFSRIETEVSLPNGLAGWGANVLASAVTFGASLPFQLYSPSTVRVDCVYSGGR